MPAKEKASEMEVSLSCNVIMEVTSHYLCCIYIYVFVRHESPGPHIYSHKRSHTGCGYQEVRITGNPSDDCQKLTTIPI